MRRGGSLSLSMSSDSKYLEIIWTAISFADFFHRTPKSTYLITVVSPHLDSQVECIWKTVFLVFIGGQGREGGPFQRYIFSIPFCEDMVEVSCREWWALLNASHTYLQKTTPSDNIISSMMATFIKMMRIRGHQKPMNKPECFKPACNDWPSGKHFPGGNWNIIDIKIEQNYI